MSEQESSEKLLRWLRDVLQDAVRLRYFDLTVRQLALLLIIHGSPDLLTVRGLAAALNVPRPTVSRALDRLCSNGLARRYDDPRDRRSILIRGSPAGVQLMQQLRSLLNRAAKTHGMGHAGAAASGEAGVEVKD
jgi:DNA-binding MarR family transcriptional regulator